MIRKCHRSRLVEGRPPSSFARCRSPSFSLVDARGGRSDHSLSGADQGRRSPRPTARVTDLPPVGTGSIGRPQLYWLGCLTRRAHVSIEPGRSPLGSSIPPDLAASSQRPGAHGSHCGCRTDESLSERAWSPALAGRSRARLGTSRRRQSSDEPRDDRRYRFARRLRVGTTAGAGQPRMKRSATARRPGRLSLRRARGRRLRRRDCSGLPIGRD